MELYDRKELQTLMFATQNVEVQYKNVNNWLTYHTAFW